MLSIVYKEKKQKNKALVQPHFVQFEQKYTYHHNDQFSDLNVKFHLCFLISFHLMPIFKTIVLLWTISISRQSKFKLPQKKVISIIFVQPVQIQIKIISHYPHYPVADLDTYHQSKYNPIKNSIDNHQLRWQTQTHKVEHVESMRCHASIALRHFSILLKTFSTPFPNKTTVDPASSQKWLISHFFHSYREIDIRSQCHRYPPALLYRKSFYTTLIDKSFHTEPKAV